MTRGMSPERRARSVRRSGGQTFWRSGTARLLWAALGLALVAVAWQLYAGASQSDASARLTVPTLDQTFASLAALLGEGEFWGYVGLTLRAWSLGLLLSVVIGVPVGVLLGTNERIYRFFRVPIEIVRPIPPIVILPLVLLILGTGLNFQLLLIVWAAVWPLLIQTTYGVQLTHKVLVDTARSFKIGALRTVILFRVPAAAPAVATALKLGAMMAFGVTIMTEFVGGSWGIGRELLVAQATDQVARTYALTLFVGVIGIAIMGLFGIVESSFARWSPGGAKR